MKLIDWSGMPKGTMTDKGPLAQTCNGNQSALVLAWGHSVAPVLELKAYPVSTLRNIGNFRIVGVDRAAGFTDNPGEDPDYQPHKLQFNTVLKK